MLVCKPIRCLALTAIILNCSSALAVEQRDPTRPPQSAVVAFEGSSLFKSYQLSSVHIGDERRWAVLNDVKVQENDMIDGYRVSQIQLNKVTLENNSNTVIVRMYESVKQTSDESRARQSGGQE